MKKKIATYAGLFLLAAAYVVMPMPDLVATLLIGVAIALIITFVGEPADHAKRKPLARRAAVGVAIGALTVGAMAVWEQATPVQAAHAAENCSSSNPCAGGGGNAWHTYVGFQKFVNRLGDGRYGNYNHDDPPAWLFKQAKKNAKANPDKFPDHWEYDSTVQGGKRWNWGFLKWTKTANDIRCMGAPASFGWMGCSASEYHGDMFNKTQPVMVRCNGTVLLGMLGGAKKGVGGLVFGATTGGAKCLHAEIQRTGGK